jgi:hypothetical protein
MVFKAQDSISVDPQIITNETERPGSMVRLRLNVQRLRVALEMCAEYQLHVHNLSERSEDNRRASAISVIHMTSRLLNDLFASFCMFDLPLSQKWTVLNPLTSASEFTGEKSFGMEGESTEIPDHIRHMAHWFRGSESFRCSHGCCFSRLVAGHFLQKSF